MNVEKWKRTAIAQVQRLAKELGKTPTAMEFNREPFTISASKAAQLFGSWNEFLIAAELNLSDRARSCSKEELIEQVHWLAKELGRTPTSMEFKKNPDTSTMATVIRKFGSWNNFLREAKIEVNRRMDYTEEELIEQVRELTKKLGRPPRVAEFSKDFGTASRSTVVYRFGSWSNFLSAAGIEKFRSYKKRSH